MEQRQDNIETEVRTLSATVARVEQNQAHATELNRLRFDALDTGLKSLAGQLDGFMKRVDGILTGEVETAQSKAGRELVIDYTQWRKSVDERLTDLKDRQDTSKARADGRFEAISWGRAVILLAFATVPAIIALIDILSR